MPGSRGKCFQKDLYKMSSFLVWFKDNLILHNHCTKRFNSLLTTGLVVPRFLPGSKRSVIYSKWWATDLEKTLLDHLYKKEKENRT